MSMSKSIISVVVIMLGIIVVGCDVCGPDKKAEKAKKDNELVGWWKEILDTVSEDGRAFFWVDDSTKASGGFWDYLNLASFYNNDSCRINGRSKYLLFSDTVWLIYRGGYFKDPNGVIVDYRDPDTAVVKYHLSTNKDTLYFEKIDHPKSRYFPNYTWDGDL